MLSIENLRKIDPEVTESLTDEELEFLRKVLYDMGQLCFEIWAQAESGSKNPPRVLEERGDDIKINLWKHQRKEA